MLLHGNSHNHSVCKGKGQISVTKISTLAVFHSQHQHLIGLVASIIRQLLVLQTISSPQFAKMACGYRAVMALINNHKTTCPWGSRKYMLLCHPANAGFCWNAITRTGMGQLLFRKWQLLVQVLNGLYNHWFFLQKLIDSFLPLSLLEISTSFCLL